MELEVNKSLEGIVQRGDATRALQHPAPQSEHMVTAVPSIADLAPSSLWLDLAAELRRTRQKLYNLQRDPRSTTRFSDGVELLAQVIMTSVHDAEDVASLITELESAR